MSWFKRSLWQREKLKIESPARLATEAFFSKKTAVVALALLTAVFLFVLIAPLFIPMDVNYTDPLQQNIAPGYSMCKVPDALAKDVRHIDGFADFTVGVSGKGEAFVWGNTENKLLKTDVKNIPATVKKEGVLFASAGKDHILAVTKTGKLVGWGDKSCGQYGFDEVLNAVTAPQALQQLAPDIVRELTCGYQTSALVQTDGKAYAWGNKNTVGNLESMREMSGVKKMRFTNSALVALLENGEISTGGEEIFTSAVSSKKGALEGLNAYLSNRKVLEIATTNKCLALLLDDGELLVSGVFENGEDKLPKLKQGEQFTSLAGGTRHFVGVTNLGKAYAWGNNAYAQCAVTAGCDSVFTGSLQTYLVKGGKLTQATGLKGYLMGTDGRGRDVFARLAHGGKMTVTVGGVAVIISSVIAIIIGAIAGYFGGVTDVILMRITEIFSSIPFLPFAMLLSQIIKNYAVGETARILIIMVILGVLSWPSLARMIRGQVLAEREKEFVTSAKAMGVSRVKIAFKHILPNVVSVILVSMTLDFAGCLLTESALSYLGFGVQQPYPTWGNMLNGANNSTVIQNYWWQWLFPALFLSLTTICINVVGDALRDSLDPKQRG